MNPTSVDDVQVPAEFVDVQLDDLVTKEGQPVIVRCFRLSQLERLEILGLPQAADPFAVSGMSTLEKTQKIGFPLIEAATAFSSPDGSSYIRPAFWFGDKVAKTASTGGGLPGALLSMGDTMKLIGAIVQLSEPSASRAAGNGFPVDREGATAGARAVESGEGNGPDAGGSPGGS